MGYKHSTTKKRPEELISITVYYDKELAEIAGTPEEKIGIPKGVTSADCLQYILDLHPELSQKFKRKKLMFEHNAQAPKAKDLLKDNDVYIVSTWTMKEMRDSLKEMLQFVLEYFSIPMTLNEVLCFVFSEEHDEADRNDLLKYFISYVHEPNLIRTVYSLINQTWLFFPHHTLNGKSPVETLQKVVRDRLK